MGAAATHKTGNNQKQLLKNGCPIRKTGKSEK